MMPMQPPRTLLLDFDGVLARYSRPDRMRHLADHAGCSPGQVHAALFGSGLETAYDGGGIDTVAYLARLGEAIGRPVDEATWIAARIAACRLRLPDRQMKYSGASASTPRRASSAWSRPTKSGAF